MDVQCANETCDKIINHIFTLGSRDARTNVGCANHTLSNSRISARVEQDGDGFLIRGQDGKVLATITKK